MLIGWIDLVLLAESDKLSLVLIFDTILVGALSSTTWSAILLIDDFFEEVICKILQPTLFAFLEICNGIKLSPDPLATINKSFLVAGFSVKDPTSSTLKPRCASLLPKHWSDKLTRPIATKKILLVLIIWLIRFWVWLKGILFRISLI